MKAAPFGEMKFLLDIKRVQQHAASHLLTLSPSHPLNFLPSLFSLVVEDISCKKNKI